MLLVRVGAIYSSFVAVIYPASSHDTGGKHKIKATYVAQERLNSIGDSTYIGAKGIFRRSSSHLHGMRVTFAPCSEHTGDSASAMSLDLKCDSRHSRHHSNAGHKCHSHGSPLRHLLTYAFPEAARRVAYFQTPASTSRYS